MAAAGLVGNKHFEKIEAPPALVDDSGLCEISIQRRLPPIETACDGLTVADETHRRELWDARAQRLGEAGVALLRRAEERLRAIE